MAGKVFSFEDLNKEMMKVSTLASTMDKNEMSVIDEYIDSGNYHLNAALTGSLFKGYPANRTVALAGVSGSGKTYLALNAVRQAIAQGYFIYYYDSENAIDKQLLTKFDIDPTKMFYIPCNTVQEFRTSVSNLTKTLIANKRKGIEIPKIMIVLDSAGNLATQKEIDDAASGSEKTDMTRAKILKSIFRIIMTPLAECKIPMILTNHIYMTQDLFSQSVAGGGCLDPNEEVLMSDYTYKRIEDINEGDFVMTLFGQKEITQTWEFNKNRYLVEFENNSTLITSEDHRFFNKNIDDWLYVKDLNEGNIVSCFKSIDKIDDLKIKNVKKLDSDRVIDLTVKDAQHYITKNGVINHNTGPEYAASIILFLSKAQLKDGDTKTGIIVTAKPNKNRFAKPTAIKFHIHFNKGMNKFVGLENYISWDTCGIERGKFLTQKEYDKLKPEDQKDCKYHSYIDDKGKEVIMWFEPSETGRGICVKHLNETIKPIELFTERVFTKEVLEAIEEKCIKAKFNYGTDELSDEDLLIETEEVSEV